MIENRKARYDYTILQDFVAGVSLIGTEVKAIREGKANIIDSYIYIENNIVKIKNFNIAQYKHAKHNEHEENREKILLLKKSQIREIVKALDKGKTVIPLKGFFDDRGRFKMLIAIAQGKKNFDKREAIKEKDLKREEQRNL